jgi:transcriptional regulator with GAF, ATPase, and Fis domain
VDARAAALSALAQFQVTETTVAQALQRIAEVTLAAVPAADVAGMSMLGDDGRPVTAVYTDAESPAIDAAQYEEGKGPCLDAWRDNVVLSVPRVEDVSDTYPAFAAACQQHGVRSTLSLPMRAGTVAVGALNLYAHVPEGFGEQDAAVGRDLAAAGAAVLVNVSAYWTAFDLTVQLQEAMESRAVIEQAKGVLLARRRDLTPDDAFDMLRKVSQRENVKLRDVARRIVEGRGGGEDRA